MTRILLNVLLIFWFCQNANGQIVMTTWQADNHYEALVSNGKATKDFPSATLTMTWSHGDSTVQISERNNIIRRPIGNFSFVQLKSTNPQYFKYHFTDDEGVVYLVKVARNYSEFSMSNGMGLPNKPIITNYSGTGLKIVTDSKL